ncbi:prealbumin-like fold domain-containing protein, partial [Chelativorans sp. YIM 93263]|uniref:prealbumin-like fold domain-containing protein n=1 Tax=Chelativorans sp. YIM 93263 TaxID=2906648 RepID=UPI00403DC6FC
MRKPISLRDMVRGQLSYLVRATSGPANSDGGKFRRRYPLTCAVAFWLCVAALGPWLGAAQAQVSGTPTATETTPPDFSAVHVPLAGGGGSLWTGGSVNFPVDSDASDGDGSQLYRGVAAALQAPRPVCDSGTASITVTVEATNNGPAAGSGYVGRLALFSAGSTTPLTEYSIGYTPVGTTETLTITEDVSAAALEAGDIVVGLWLETHHAGGKSWTAEQFEPSYTYDTAGCEADLSITKDNGEATYIPGGDTTYTIAVTNNGPQPATGAEITDPLPAGITNASWTCGEETSGGVCGATSGSGGIATTADLPAGASVTYTLTMGIPSSYSGNLTNTAAVAPPDGITDTDTSNNSASDTDTMEPPPTSGVCSPRVVTAGNTFTLAPFPVTGTVQKTAGAWQTDQPWATQGGGNYTIQWNFSQPIPANWIQFAVIDVNETGTTDYDAVPPVFTVDLGAGSTATTADFSLVSGDLTYSGGAVRYSPGGPYRQSGFVHGTSADTVTSITITSSNVSGGDNIANSLFVRPPCVTISKVSEGGTGSFQIDMTNLVQADGATVPSTTLTTTAAGTAVSSPMYFARDTRVDVTLSEVVPADWALRTAVCTDQNAASTGNPTVIGTFASPATTIPAANVRPEADIQCVFTNEQRAADLSITKDDGATTYAPGTDVVYTIVATNNGPDDVTDAAISDPLPAGITTASWTCGSEVGGAVCDAASGTGAIATTADLPAGASVTYMLTMSVPADFTGDLVNTATITEPAGVVDATPDNNTATDTDTPADPVVSVRKELIGESITTNDVAEPGEVLTYRVTITHEGGSAFNDFDFIENIPNGATMTRVDGASGFTNPVAGSSTVQLTVDEVPVGGEALVEIDLTVAAPIPLGITEITNRISGGDVPPDCTECSVTTPAPPYTPNPPDTMSCSTSGAYFNTAYDGAGGRKTSGFDNYWQVALTPTPVNGPPPAGLTWGGATIVTNPPAVYISSPFGNAGWISNSSTATHPTPVNYDIFYRYQFNLDSAVDPSSLDLQMSFYADNSVYEVWVNGQPQGIQSNFGTADPYFYAGFSAGGVANGSMNGDWQAGLNTVIVHIKSGPGAQAFMAQINTDAICQPKITLRKQVVNDNGGTNVAADFTLRATNNDTPADLIEGPMGDAAVTNASIPAGTYTLGEDTLPGYAPSLYSCAIDGAAATPVAHNELTLANGQNAICTITNDDFAPVKALTAESGSIAGVAEPGETLTYTVTLTNNGGSPALYDLTDNIDDLTSYVAGSTAGTAGAGEPTGSDPLIWSGITIPASSSVTVEYQVTVADTIPDSVTEIGNVAYKVGEPEPDCSVTPPPAGCVVVPTPGAAVPSKALTGESGSIAGVAEPGETLTYTVMLTNSDAAAALYDLTDNIDDNTAYVAGSASVAGAAREPAGSDPLVWDDILVPANGTVAVVYQVTVANPIPAGVSEIRNAATDDCTANPDACVVTPTPGTAVPSKALTGESGSIAGVAEPG